MPSHGAQLVAIALAAAVASAPQRAAGEPPRAGRPDEEVVSAAPPAASDGPRAGALMIVGGLYATLFTWTYFAWYFRGSEVEFTVVDEGWFGADTYAGGADKLGHLWSNYALTRGVSRMLRWGGFAPRTALLTSWALASTFFVAAEVKDGYHRGFGFSWSDMAMNAGGELLGVLLETSPRLDAMFDFRLEYFPSAAFFDAVREHGPFDTPEDYTGQTYLLAFHLGSLDAVREHEWLRWAEYVDVTAGFRAIHYKPDVDDPSARRQQLFVGVSLNLQRVIDRTLAPAPRAGGAAARPSTGVRMLRFVSEIYAPPFTTLELGSVGRSPGAPPARAR